MRHGKEDSAPRPARVALLHELAAALQRVGTPPGRVECTLAEVSDAIGLRGSFFALPAAVLVCIETVDGEQTRVVSAPTGDPDLASLEGVRRVARQVVDGDLDIEGARRAIRAVLTAPPAHPFPMMLLAYAWTSAVAAVLFGGHSTEAAVAGLAGGLIGALLERGPAWGLSGLLEALSAALAALLATALATVVPFNPDVSVLSALIVLVPGFTIHRGLADLSTGHLLSGSSRMSRAVAVLLLMGFGVALGGRTGAALGVPLPSPPPLELPAWVQTVALVAMTPALAVLFRAPRRSWFWMGAASLVAWFGAYGGGVLLGRDLGPFLGALALGVYALGWERTFDRPAALPLAPGLLVLVPGSIGFRGVAALLGGDPVTAVETAFSALLVATSLVTGLLLANVLVRGTPDTPPDYLPAEPG